MKGIGLAFKLMHTVLFIIHGCRISTLYTKQKAVNLTNIEIQDIPKTV